MAGTQSGEWSKVVVGVDGSETSRAALRFAAGEAAAHDAELQVVHAWEASPPGAGVGSPPAGLGGAGSQAQRDAAEQLLGQVLKEELGDAQPTKLRQTIGRGSPAKVLLDAAEDASLLVVGSRGLGGFAGLLLGSVSQKLTHHAGCPVVIVRPPAQRDQS